MHAFLALLFICWFCFSHLLLGSKGLDLLQLGQKLDAISARKTFEPLEPACDTDIATYLKNEQENAILSIIEETHQLVIYYMHLFNKSLSSDRACSQIWTLDQAPDFSEGIWAFKSII